MCNTVLYYVRALLTPSLLTNQIAELNSAVLSSLSLAAHPILCKTIDAHFISL